MAAFAHAICLSYANFIETCRKQTHAQTHSVISYLSQSHVWLTCYIVLPTETSDSLALNQPHWNVHLVAVQSSWKLPRLPRLPSFTTRFHWWHPPQGSPKKTKNGRSRPPSNKGPLAHTHSMPGILCCFSSGIAGCHRFLTMRLLAHLKQISPRTPVWHQNGRRHVKYVKPLSTPKVDSFIAKRKNDVWPCTFHNFDRSFVEEDPWRCISVLSQDVAFQNIGTGRIPGILQKIFGGTGLDFDTHLYDLSKKNANILSNLSFQKPVIQDPWPATVGDFDERLRTRLWV